MTKDGSPEFFVLAGPNGAGKSTTAPVLLPATLGVHQFVNADNIASGLSPFAPETAAFQAGRLMLGRVRELFNSRLDFALESTLSGRRYVPFLREAGRAGYLVNIIYLWLTSQCHVWPIEWHSVVMACPRRPSVAGIAAALQTSPTRIARSRIVGHCVTIPDRRH